MLPSTASALAVFLSLGANLVAADALDRRGGPIENFLNSFLGTQSSPASEPPVHVVPVIISVDANGVAHTITGAPTGAAGPAAKTVTTSILTSETMAPASPTHVSTSQQQPQPQPNTNSDPAPPSGPLGVDKTESTPQNQPPNTHPGSGNSISDPMGAATVPVGGSTTAGSIPNPASTGPSTDPGLNLGVNVGKQSPSPGPTSNGGLDLNLGDGPSSPKPTDSEGPTSTDPDLLGIVGNSPTNSAPTGSQTSTGHSPLGGILGSSPNPTDSTAGSSTPTQPGPLGIKPTSPVSTGSQNSTGSSDLSPAGSPTSSPLMSPGSLSGTADSLTVPTSTSGLDGILGLTPPNSGTPSAPTQSPTESASDSASISDGASSSHSGLPGVLPTISVSVPAIPTPSTNNTLTPTVPSGSSSPSQGSTKSIGSTSMAPGLTATMISPSVPTSTPASESSSVTPVPFGGTTTSSQERTATASSSPLITPTESTAPASSTPLSTPSTTSSSSSHAPPPVVVKPTTRKPAKPAQPTTTQVVETTAPQPTTDSNNFVPATILVEPPVTKTHTATHTTATQTSAPTPELPGSISPADGLDKIPENSTLIQLGFNGNLKYSFVATTTLSSSQIFLYVPEGLEYALQDLAKQVTMFAIRPYDNSQATGYVATVALAYIPMDQKEELRTMLHNPHSRLYEQPNDSVRALMSMIDPSIPLDVGGAMGATGGTSRKAGGSGGDGSGDGGNDSNDSSDAGASSSSTTKASSVGIGVGVVAGAAAYGAGMFWVARRYRRKRQGHQRSSSTADQMSQAPGSLFGGASRYSDNSGSNRTQMISAPVMAENSLGWN